MLQSTVRRSARRLWPVALVALVAIGCDNNNDVINNVAADAVASATDTFTDTLTVNAAKTFPFIVANPGDITAVLSTLSPDSSQIVGLSLGTWNSSTFSCQIVLTNDAAVQSSSVAGHATAASTFCLRVFDSTGKLPQPVSYTVTVTHP